MIIHALTPATEQPRVLVAICHNLDIVQRTACQSLMGLGFGNRVDTAKELYGIAEITFAWFTAFPRVDALRDAALSQAMKDGFTHVIFLDADMLHPDDLFLRLLKHLPHEAVISGFYTQRHFPFGPIAMRDSELHESGLYRIYRRDRDYADVDAHGLREQELVGMGCALIPLSLVAKLGPRPWFEYKDDEHGWPCISEDVPFCEKVRAVGGKIYLDPSIQCGHLFTDAATEQHFRRYQAVEAATAEKLKGCVSIHVVDGAPADEPAGVEV